MLNRLPGRHHLARQRVIMVQRTAWKYQIAERVGGTILRLRDS